MNNRKYDPREAPSYGIVEAAHYLNLPKATLRSWVLGRNYTTTQGRQNFYPLLEIADHNNKLLSFINLVEAHVLAAIRREHNVELPKIRAALEYTKKKLGVARPLAEQQFETNGVDLFVERLGELVNVSANGQKAMREVLHFYLKRIERDPRGIPIKLFPFTRTSHTALEGCSIVIDPTISFGRPSLTNRGIPTAILAERYKAGDSIDTLADDYGAQRDAIEEAIRCELELKAA
jgi:uncharacterized protein (DUF433 family)